MTGGKVPISPDTSIIERIRLAGHMNWPKVIAELVDNALDAGAKTVTLDFRQPQRLVVTDNGKGCDNLLRMVVYGRRRDHDTTHTGMYGVGSKDAAIWIASRTAITSVCGGIRRSVAVDWDDVCGSGRWEIDPPDEEPTDASPGTRITLDGFLRAAPSSWKDLERSLGNTFASAIRSGVSLAVRRPRCDRHEPVEASPPPDLADAVELDLDVGRGGRKARVTMGILQKDSQRPMQGMTIAMRGGRVLRSRTRVGLGVDPTPGLYGYAEIYPRSAWRIYPNKDGVDERQEQELAEAIASHTLMAGLIDKARSRGHDIHLDRINSVLGIMSQEIGGPRDRKARRSPTAAQTGAVSPTGRGSPHRRAARSQAGSTFSEGRPPRGGKMSIHVHPCGEDGPLFDVAGPAVYVNSQHAFYGHAGGDMRVIAPLAVAYFAIHSSLSGQQLIPFPEVAEGQCEELSRQVTAVLECLARAEQQSAEAQSVPA